MIRPEAGPVPGKAGASSCPACFLLAHSGPLWRLADRLALVLHLDDDAIVSALLVEHHEQGHPIRRPADDVSSSRR